LEFYKKKTEKYVLSFFKMLKQHFSNKKNIKLFYKNGCKLANGCTTFKKIYLTNSQFSSVK
jgi:hypothetical protein